MCSLSGRRTDGYRSYWCRRRTARCIPVPQMRCRNVRLVQSDSCLCRVDLPCRFAACPDRIVHEALSATRRHRRTRQSICIRLSRYCLCVRSADRCHILRPSPALHHRRKAVCATGMSPYSYRLEGRCLNRRRTARLHQCVRHRSSGRQECWMQSLRL